MSTCVCMYAHMHVCVGVYVFFMSTCGKYVQKLKFAHTWVNRYKEIGPP